MGTSMSMPRGQRNALMALAWIGGCLFCACTRGATTLDLDFVDPDGQPVQVAKAELLLLAWGATKRIELEMSGDGLDFVLDPDWLRSRWPARFNDLIGAYLYLQAPPFVAIRSERFQWPGVDPEAGAVTIGFPTGRSAVVDVGSEAKMTLAFRTGSVRRVRIVDTQGAPLSGIAIDAYMFWSQSNRCAVLTGGEPLGSYVTDAGGWIEVPDGDFEYALELASTLRGDHVFVADGRYERERLVTDLRQVETDVVVHRFPIRPLKMRILRPAGAAAGVVLHGHMSNCSCGACSGPLAATDEAGAIRLDGFQPEKWSSAWLLDGDRERWRTTPTAWPTTNIEILLSAADDSAVASFSP